MSEIMLTILDADRAIHGTVHGSTANAIAAALAAEPETIEELEAAVARFMKPREGIGPFDLFHPGACDEAWDAGVAIVDLAGRFFAVNSTYAQPRPQGQVTYHNGEEATDIRIPYQAPAEWRFRRSVRDWRRISEARRAERAAVPPLDARKVLYGEVGAFIARECLAALAAGVEDPIAEIHARWLMTPRADLRGRSPRDWLLERQNQVDLDLQWRELQWSFVGEPPPGLSPDSAAYRFGGFGTHENVLYYNLLRHLLGECWRRLREEGTTPADVEAEGLNRLMHEWLYAPQQEDHGMTPFYIIACERSRMPVTLSGRQMVVDDDCPLCQMLGEGDAPTFWHLDGCNMDDDFPFSFYRTREEWEQERRKWEEWSREWEEKHAAREAGGDAGAPAPVWSGSYVNWDSMESLPRAQTLELALVGVGAHLGEIVVGLREVEQGAERVQSLNQHFAELRDAIGSDTRWLARIVIRQFREELAQVGDAVPAVAAKCADLAGRLEWLAGRAGE